MKNWYIIFIISLLFGLSIDQTLGQDVRFNNINSDLISVSPALLTFESYSLQAGANYRQAINLSSTRGGTNPTIASINRLYSVFIQKGLLINGKDKFNFQARISSDNPTNGVVKRTDLEGTIGMTKVLSTNGKSTHQLSIGTTIGFHNISPTNNSFWFGSQYDVENQRVNLGLPSGEISLDRLVGRSALDLSIGLDWLSHFENVGTFRFGASIFHLLPYNQSIYDNGNLMISRRYTGYSNLNLDINSATHMISTIIGEYQNPFITATWRNMILFDVKSKVEMSYGFGLAPRWVDNFDVFGLESIGLFTLINIPSWQLELSYDIGVGDITRFTDSRGNIEIGAKYLFGRISEKYTLPKFL